MFHLLAQGSTGGGGGSSLATYGPLLAAVASVGAVFISWLSRKDKRSLDRMAMQDTQANTAIKGLSEAYDRVDAERKREAERADEAEARVHELEAQLAKLKGPEPRRRKATP